KRGPDFVGREVRQWNGTKSAEVEHARWRRDDPDTRAAEVGRGHERASSERPPELGGDEAEAYQPDLVEARQRVAGDRAGSDPAHEFVARDKERSLKGAEGLHAI